MAFYQVLVAVLALAALILLLFAAYQGLREDAAGVNAAAAAAGGVVTGAGALFLLRQRADARKAHAAAQASLKACG